MDVIFEQYAERLRRKNRAPRTRVNFQQAAGRLDQWLRAQGIAATAADFTALEEYFDGLELAPSSKRTHLAMIRAAYSYALKRGTIRLDPTVDVEIEREPDSEPRIIPNECLRTIKERAVLDLDWLLFHFLTYTGMRRAEIQKLQWEDVLIPDSTLRVVGKGGKLRLVPIHPALGEILAEGVGEGPVLPSRGKHIAEDTMHQAVKRLSPTFTPHDYRRTVATSLARNGVEERVIDRIMGWAPRSVRGRYYVNVAGEELQRAILKLYADDPI